MKEIVIATSNPGKLEEFKEMLKDMEVELHYLAEWPGIEAPEENGRTFAANARLKATYYAKATGMTCIADDSGLEVQALDGEPGVRSARYAGEKATDKENNDLLLANMKLQVKRTCVSAALCAWLTPPARYLWKRTASAKACCCTSLWAITASGMTRSFGLPSCTWALAKQRRKKKIKSATAAKPLKNLLPTGRK